MDAIETIERDGCVAEIHVDSDAGNPRTEFDSVGLLVQLSRSFIQPDASDWRADALIEAWGRFGDPASVERYARAFLGAAAVAWWDDPSSASRIVAVIDREDAEREGIPDPLAYLVGEIEQYAAWSLGEVYGYVVNGPDGEHIDSCWGYYGDGELSYVRERINDAIEAHRAEVHAERVELYRGLVG